MTEIPWDEMIGETVEHTIEGVLVRDVVVKRYLPDGTAVVGPRLTLAHIFARWTMIPAMDQTSENTEAMLKDFVGE